MTKNEGVPTAQIWNIDAVKQKFAEQFGVAKASLVKGRWVALKRRLGGIPHAATPLFCKVFGEFVLPARIPPDRLKGDPTPFDKGVFGAANSSINIYLTLFQISWLEHPQGVRRICSAPSSLTAALPIPQ